MTLRNPGIAAVARQRGRSDGSEAGRATASPGGGAYQAAATRAQGRRSGDQG